MRVDGVLFDKDGTLFDFHSTWSGWMARVIRTLSDGDANLADRLANAIRFDLAGETFFPDSVVIAGTNMEMAEVFASALGEDDPDKLDRWLAENAAEADLAPAVPLQPFLDGLAKRGLRLGVMTNDSELAARAHLDAVGVTSAFDFIAGFDSGHGAKPDPAPLLAFADATGLLPERVVMVGDSTHDLIAGRAAGMQTVAVLTGFAEQAELAPFADAVLPDIGHLTGWIAA